MAKAKKSNSSKNRSDADQSIIIQQITVGQLNRGSQTIQTWYNNLRSAESSRNPNRRQLLNTYLDVSIDLHLRSVMDKRTRAVKTTPFEWTGLENEEIIRNFKAPWFIDLLEIIMSRKFYGHTLCEFGIGADGLIDRADLIPRQNVKPDKGIISLDGNSDNGPGFREQPYSNYILEIGKPDELGLLASIAPYVLMKRDNMADFARYNEMFGIPLRWYEYDPNDPTARQKVTEAAEQQGSAAYVVVPKGTSVNFVESVKQATAYAFDKFHEIMNNEITIGVLGQLLTTGGEGGGSYELGKVHQAVERGINLEDRLTAEYIINYPFKNNILLPHGYPLEAFTGYFVMTEELSMEKKAEVYLKIAERFPIDPKFLYDEFGIPEPTPEAVSTWERYRSQSTTTGQSSADGGSNSPKLNSRSTGATVAKLYASHCKHRHQMKAVSSKLIEDLDKLIEDLIRALYERQEAVAIAEQISSLITQEFETAVREGFGDVTGAADKTMIDALLADVKVFSGFKTEKFLRDATSLLVDESGAVRTFSAFRDETMKLNNQYNVDFLRTEYNHAIASARMASKWNGIMADKETLPLLQYITAGDARVRQSHRPLDKIILPADHPFWDTYMPPNDWNCRCNVKQLADGEQTVVKTDQLPQIKDEFRFNPGKQKVIFPKTHPYYNDITTE